MIDRKDLKGMIRALKSGEVVWYAPDHDYGPQASVFVPFFAVEEAATTTGTWMLARMSKAAIVPFVPRRKPDGSGYELMMLEPELAPPLDDAETTARWMNGIVENASCSHPSSTCGCTAALKRAQRARRPAIDFQDAILRVASCFSFKSSPSLRQS
jgi:lauroyl/myristoyl acyltransferase